MTRRAGLLLGLGLALVLGLLASYLLGKLEPYEEVVEHGPAPEVASSPYLAAEHFLRRQGIEARRADGLEVLDGLPSQGQTLMLLADRGNMTPRQVERLLQWTANGGHLLFIAERLWNEEEGRSGDLLLDLLGIQQYMSDELDEEEAAEDDEINGDGEPYPDEQGVYQA